MPGTVHGFHGSFHGGFNGAFFGGFLGSDGFLLRNPGADDKMKNLLAAPRRIRARGGNRERLNVADND
jgi:hypothetical protein